MVVVLQESSQRALVEIIDFQQTLKSLRRMNMEKLDGFDISFLVVVCVIALVIMCGIGALTIKEVATIMAGCG